MAVLVDASGGQRQPERGPTGYASAGQVRYRPTPCQVLTFCTGSAVAYEMPGLAYEMPGTDVLYAGTAGPYCGSTD
eukprot:1381690-Rhodomonas_salina.9